MIEPLHNATYRRLFLSHVLALVATGLTTVALALLAYDLAGGEAGAVLGTALAIKMLTYVAIGPLAGAVAGWFPRRGLLVSLNLIRGGVVLLLPFVTEIWQIYALVFTLQAASAMFTPTLQATVPDIIPDEATYTQALSLTRLAHDLENLLSPALAAMLLLFMSFHWLFGGTVIGLLIAAAIVYRTPLPTFSPGAVESGVGHRATLGLRIFAATPRLRGLLALNMAVAAGGAMALVNTVIYVRDSLGLGDNHVAMAIAAFGAGSMLIALMLPAALEYLRERSVMLGGAVLIGAALTLGLLGPDFLSLLLLWFLLGAGSSLVLTPSGRLLRRSAQPEDRPTLFAAQFSLSHACWLFTYPLAGWLGLYWGLEPLFAGFAILSFAAAAAAWRLWPADDSLALEHVHADLPAGHHHIRDALPVNDGFKHCHTYNVDRYHGYWPGPGRLVRAMRRRRAGQTGSRR
ncbi:MFS family permease [Natronocella acetinitrilica]|uniref:MFS family permease n=1 Tax=Natronocella acetinitrilica TaxID=414046 RepID=A0AAE3G6P4_9GAMM|nr:MFS transporter [Natronocella acetinitrilica]MCP1674847.1 MFS family permease [Natronocella acetinitrilica]